MKKRGQVTILIIMGLVVVVVVGLLIFILIRSNTNMDSTTPGIVSEDITSTLSEEIESCMDAGLLDALDLVYYYGGHLQSTPYNFTYSGRLVNLLCYDEKDGMISFLNPNFIIENKISNYVVQYTSECMNFEKYEREGYVIEKEIPSAEVLIGDKKVSVVLSWVVSFNREGSTNRLEEFSVSVNSGLGTLLDIVNDIVEEEIIDDFTGQELVDYRLTIDPTLKIVRDDITSSVSVYNLTYPKEQNSFYFGCRRTK